ncbi:MAG: ABC-2 family transporter protein [bacterium]|nr:ABC-2 family transporter protein [bacterium]
MFAAYYSFIRLSFLKMLAYRLRYVVGITTYLVFISVHYYIWQAVYSSSSSSVINGYTLPEMLTYVVVGWLARTLYHSNVDYEIDSMVRSGDVRNFLLRPLDFQGVMLSQAFGETVFRLFFFTVPTSIFLLQIFPVQAAVSTRAFVYFVCATAMSFVVLAAVNFVVGMLSFSFKSVRGIIMAKYHLVQLCSGLLLPIVFFPQPLRQVIEWLPFYTISYLPLQIYLGKIEGEAIHSALLTQALWAVVLIVLGHFYQRREFRRLSIQGG